MELLAPVEQPVTEGWRQMGRETVTLQCSLSEHGAHAALVPFSTACDEGDKGIPREGEGHAYTIRPTGSVAQQCAYRQQHGTSPPGGLRR